MKGSTYVDTVSVPLSKGKVALIDQEDAPLITAYWWHAVLVPSGKIYAARHFILGDDKTTLAVLMHRLIMEAPHGMQVDHIDGDGLNNRRENLRLATPSQNRCWKPALSSNKSGYKGVSWDKARGKWTAHVCISGKQKNIGRYDTAEEAARAYDDAATGLHGAFVWRNFPTS